jgi:hypothetical protein
LPRRKKLKAEDIVHCAFGPLDSGTQQGFLPHIHGKKKVSIGEGAGEAVESTYLSVGMRQKANQGLVEFDLRDRRKVDRLESPVSFELLDVTTGSWIRFHAYLCVRNASRERYSTDERDRGLQAFKQQLYSTIVEYSGQKKNHIPRNDCFVE